MNKKILTAAVGAALAAGPMLAAQADVKVYGMVQFELASEDVDNKIPLGLPDDLIVRSKQWQRTATGATDGSALTMEDNQRGRFGFKADEDLGGGLKGFAKIEYDIGGSNESNFGDGSSIREANVGLAGGWGTVTVGTQKSPYKYTGGITYDPFVATNLEARRNGGMTGGVAGHNGFMSNAIAYQTAKGSPVNVWVAYSPDEKGGGGTGANALDDSGDYALGVKFGDKNWEAFVKAVNNADNASGPNPEDYSATSIGGKFKTGPHTFLVQYEDTSNDNIVAPGVNLDGTVLFLGYHLKFGGNNTLVVQFADGELEATGDPVKQEWTYTTVGVIHKFSKTTRLFAGYTSTDVDNYDGDTNADGDRTALSIGLRKDF